MDESIPMDKKAVVFEAALFGKLKNTGQFTDEQVHQIIDEIKTDTKVDDPYQQLLVAVQDLLCELKITDIGLVCMSEGTSPCYPGKVMCEVNGENKPVTSHDTLHKIQLSGVTARKLVAAGVIN
jgi:hypothetical protein